MIEELRKKLVKISLEWEKIMGVAPHITGSISEYDAMKLIGMSDKDINEESNDKTSVQKGFDFTYKKVRYQVKANRPSGKKGSFVTLTSKARNYEFDKLMWILYNKNYEIEEAYICDVKAYKENFHDLKHVRPNDIRKISKKLV